MAVPNYCPILRKMPHGNDCRYCGAFSYLEQMCRHEDLKELRQEMPIDYLTEQAVSYKLQQIQAWSNHLEKRLNEHIDSSKKPTPRTGYEGLTP